MVNVKRRIKKESERTKAPKIRQPREALESLGLAVSFCPGAVAKCCFKGLDCRGLESIVCLVFTL